jgi:hypothetical protein
MAEIILHPAGGGRYSAIWSGAVIATASAAITAGARALLELGVPPDEELIARHKGSDIIAMRGTVGGFAKLTVKETPNGPRLVPWTPSDRNGDSDRPDRPTAAEEAEGRPADHPHPADRLEETIP